MRDAKNRRSDCVGYLMNSYILVLKPNTEFLNLVYVTNKEILWTYSCMPHKILAPRIRGVKVSLCAQGCCAGDKYDDPRVDVGLKSPTRVS